MKKLAILKLIGLTFFISTATADDLCCSVPSGITCERSNENKRLKMSGVERFDVQTETITLDFKPMASLFREPNNDTNSVERNFLEQCEDVLKEIEIQARSEGYLVFSSICEYDRGFSGWSINFGDIGRPSRYEGVVRLVKASEIHNGFSKK